MARDISERKPLISLWIELTLRDEDGRVIMRRTEKSHSWVFNIIRALYALMVTTVGNYVTSFTFTDGRIRTYPGIYNIGDSLMQLNAPAGNAGYGIVVGSGTNPVSIYDYNLQSQIGHGSGSGQLLYGDTIVEPITVSGNAASFLVYRNFTGNQYNTVTVNEVGLVASYTFSGGGFYFLIARDVISPSVSVNPNAGLTVGYRFTLSV